VYQALLLRHAAHLAVMKGVTNKTERKQMVEAILNQTNLWNERKKALSTFSVE